MAFFLTFFFLTCYHDGPTIRRIVLMCAHTHMHAHTHIHAHTHMHTHTHIHACRSTYAHLHTYHTYTPRYLRAYTRDHRVCVCVCVCVCLCLCKRGEMETGLKSAVKIAYKLISFLTHPLFSFFAKQDAIHACLWKHIHI